MRHPRNRRGGRQGAIVSSSRWQRGCRESKTNREATIRNFQNTSREQAIELPEVKRCRGWRLVGVAIHMTQSLAFWDHPELESAFGPGA